MLILTVHFFQKIPWSGLVWPHVVDWSLSMPGMTLWRLFFMYSLFSPPVSYTLLRDFPQLLFPRISGACEGPVETCMALVFHLSPIGTTSHTSLKIASTQLQQPWQVAAFDFSCDWIENRKEWHLGIFLSYTSWFLCMSGCMQRNMPRTECVHLGCYITDTILSWESKGLKKINLSGFMVPQVSKIL